MADRSVLFFGADMHVLHAQQVKLWSPRFKKKKKEKRKYLVYNESCIFAMTVYTCLAWNSMYSLDDHVCTDDVGQSERAVCDWINRPKRTMARRRIAQNYSVHNAKNKMACMQDKKAVNFWGNMQNSQSKNA